LHPFIFDIDIQPAAGAEALAHRPPHNPGHFGHLFFYLTYYMSRQNSIPNGARPIMTQVCAR
jgi:hypothetical protein